MSDVIVSLPDATDDELETLLANLGRTAHEHNRCASWCADGADCTKRHDALACIDAILDETRGRGRVRP